MLSRSESNFFLPHLNWTSVTPSFLLAAYVLIVSNPICKALQIQSNLSNWYHTHISFIFFPHPVVTSPHATHTCVFHPVWVSESGFHTFFALRFGKHGEYWHTGLHLTAPHTCLIDRFHTFFALCFGEHGECEESCLQVFTSLQLTRVWVS